MIPTPSRIGIRGCPNGQVFLHEKQIYIFFFQDKQMGFSNVHNIQCRSLRSLDNQTKHAPPDLSCQPQLSMEHHFSLQPSSFTYINWSNQYIKCIKCGKGTNNTHPSKIYQREFHGSKHRMTVSKSYRRCCCTYKCSSNQINF